MVGAVQCVNVLDFMIVMPLGPDFAAALGIAKHDIPMIGAAYTAAGALGGLLGSVWLDRFDRRAALIVCLLGLFASTAAAAFATGLASLCAARLCAGLFGGPASSMALSIVADIVPPERRGRALGAVGGAFSIASVLGVPVSLELARHLGWQAPFYAVALCGLGIALAVPAVIPSMRSHLSHGTGVGGWHRTFDLLRDPTMRVAYAATLLLWTSSFAIVPILSTYLQYNLGYPREHLATLYLCGGAVSFFSMRVVGRIVDRRGSGSVSGYATAGLAPVLWLWFVQPLGVAAVLTLFVGYMLMTSTRNVAFQAVTSKLPRSGQRAGYLSLQSSVAHMAAALGAYASSWILIDRADGGVGRMNVLALCSLALALPVPWMLGLLERRIGARDRSVPIAANPILTPSTPEESP